MRSSVGGALIVALAGIGACTAAVVHFLLQILFNKLPWSAEQPIRHYYNEVGRSYTQGFFVGFFLCFSLAIGAVALSTWLEARRRERLEAAASAVQVPQLRVLK